MAQQQQVAALHNQRGGGSVDQIGSSSSVNRIDIQSLAASGQLSPQALAALHAEMLGQPLPSMVMPPIDPSTTLLQASLPLISDREALTATRPIRAYPSGVNEIGTGFAGWVPPNQLPMTQVGPNPMVNVVHHRGAHQVQVNQLTSAYHIGSSSNYGNPFNNEGLMMFQGNLGVNQQNMAHQQMGYSQTIQQDDAYTGHVTNPGFALQSQGELQGRNLGFVGREDVAIPSRFAGDEFDTQAYGMNQPAGGPHQAGSAQPEGPFGFTPGDIMGVVSK